MYKNRDEGRIPDRIERLTIVTLIALVIGVTIFSAVFFTTMFGSVGTGYAALLIDPWGQTISEPIFGPRWYIKAPWVEVKTIYYATDTYEDVIPCFSRDQLEMNIQILIRWSLDPTKLRNLYISYPALNYKTKAIESITEETIRLVTKNYTVIQTLEQRDKVALEIQERVLTAIQNEPSIKGALIHLEFDLKDIGYPTAYTKAIEEKLIAEQRKIQAQFERDRILVLANATAQEMIIKAQGEATARIIVAQSIKQAIQLISEATGITNTTRLVELYLYLEALKEIAPNVNILIITMGKDGIPIFYQIPSSSTG